MEPNILLESNFFKATVNINNLGEHHMGASSIEFSLDKKFRGIKSLLSTNGEAAFDDKSSILIISDALIILIFGYKKKEVFHINCKKPNLFKSVKISNSILRYEKYNYKDNKSSKHNINLINKNLPLGYGPVTNGKMPSAYNQ